MSFSEAGDSSRPRVSAMSMAVEMTPPAAPSPCGGGGGDGNSTFAESSAYGFASASAKSGRKGNALWMRAEFSIPAGSNTYFATSVENGAFATCAIGRDAQENETGLYQNRVPGMPFAVIDSMLRSVSGWVSHS